MPTKIGEGRERFNRPNLSYWLKQEKQENPWNKRPMGHIAHLRKQFKSINTYDYIITLIREEKQTLLTLGEFIGSSFEETWIPFTQGCFVPSLVEIGSVVLEKKILKFRQCIFTIS